MKFRLIGCILILAGGPVHARTWQTPVMATWTGDPHTTVTLAWERRVPGTARVAFHEVPAAGQAADQKDTVVDVPETTGRHVITLRDLRPGRHYEYALSSSDGYEARGGFWTTPADPQQPFTFILHNDLQGGINVEAAKAVAAGVVAAHPDFVLSAGDLADSRYAVDYPGVIQSWDLFFECLAQELAAFVFQPVSGNHDEPENPDSFWFRLFELPDAHDYTLDAGPIRFILVDSTEEAVPSRTAWLAQALQQAAFDPRVRWVVPVFHRPPFSEGERAGDDGIRNWWVPLFTKYEAGLVLSGHAHAYQRTEPIEGVPYLVSGGGGGWLYQVAPEQPGMACATSTYHFVQFQVAGERIGLEAKLPDGRVFDHAEYTAHRFVRVEPAFPERGGKCTVWYDPAGGPLADAARVTLHLGRDEFNNLLQDVPMVREAASGRWQATFTVPDSPKWNLVFCFFDPDTNRWHNNYSRNWQALLGREW